MYSTFETLITVRPDDIDMNNHVHYSKYLDYLLMARYDQMKKDYKVSMEEFVEMGFAWVASAITIHYKRPILLQDGTVKVLTRIQDFKKSQVIISFEIVKGEKNKVAASGQATFTMISVKNGRPARIPEEIIDRYQI